MEKKILHAYKKKWLITSNGKKRAGISHLAYNTGGKTMGKCLRVTEWGQYSKNPTPRHKTNIWRDAEFFSMGKNV